MSVSILRCALSLESYQQTSPENKIACYVLKPSAIFDVANNRRLSQIMRKTLTYTDPLSNPGCGHNSYPLSTRACYS